MTPAASPKLPTYAVVASLGLLGALALRRPEPLVIAAPFLLALVLGLARARAPELEVGVSIDRDRVSEGDTVTLSITLRSANGLGQVEIEPLVPTELEPLRGSRILAFRLAPGERRTLAYAVRCRRWGGYVLGDLAVRATDSSGLLVWDARHAWRLPLRVYPAREALRAAPRPMETQAFSGNQVARAAGDGVEFADVRDFQPGDRVRHVNWRLSDRRGRLAVNEQHPERNADVVLFLDSFDELARQGVSTLDLAVRGAASLAEHYLRQRDRVGLISFGGGLRWLVPGMGLRQRYLIAEALIDTHVVLSFAWKGIGVIPPRTLPPKAMVVALTPLLDDRSVRALLDLRGRGFDLVVVEISPLSFVSPGAHRVDELAFRLWVLQRDVLRLQFQSMGVPVAAWRPGEPLQKVLEEVRRFRRSTRRAYASAPA